MQLNKDAKPSSFFILCRLISTLTFYSHPHSFSPFHYFLSLTPFLPTLTLSSFHFLLTLILFPLTLSSHQPFISFSLFFSLFLLPIILFSPFITISSPPLFTLFSPFITLSRFLPHSHHFFSLSPFLHACTFSLKALNLGSMEDALRLSTRTKQCPPCPDATVGLSIVMQKEYRLWVRKVTRLQNVWNHWFTASVVHKQSPI